MRDEDLERQLAKYAPAPPPPALRARIVSEARNAGRPQHGAVWRTLAGESFWLAAAALAICAVSLTVAADRAIARTSSLVVAPEAMPTAIADEAARDMGLRPSPELRALLLGPPRARAAVPPSAGIDLPSEGPR